MSEKPWWTNADGTARVFHVFDGRNVTVFRRVTNPRTAETVVHAVNADHGARELVDGLIKVFEGMKTIREAAGDPAARGVQVCLDHVRELREGMA